MLQYRRAEEDNAQEKISITMDGDLREMAEADDRSLSRHIDLILKNLKKTPP